MAPCCYNGVLRTVLESGPTHPAYNERLPPTYQSRPGLNSSPVRWRCLLQKAVARTGALLRRKRNLMKTLRITILLMLGSACPMLAAESDTDPMTLEKAKELGRMKSRFLKESNTDKKANQAVPKANLSYFQKSIGPILNKSCIACHGPQKSEGRLRVDKLNPDLLTGPDVERWREIYNVLSNSEMPPEDEPDYALADADRGNIVDWLGDEMNKASVVRRNNTEHSSFRRMTKYEYNYALQDLLGLSYALANSLPPETASEDGFKNSSELLPMSYLNKYRPLRQYFCSLTQTLFRLDFRVENYLRLVCHLSLA